MEQSVGTIHDDTLDHDTENAELMLIGGQNAPIDAAPEPLCLDQISVDVLMFGRDPITPFTKLLKPAPRYWGDRGGHLKMDLLRKLYLLTAENVKRAREG